MGALGAILGASWAVSGRRKTDKEQTQKSLKNLKKSMILASSGFPACPLGGLLGRLGGFLGTSWAVLGHLGTIVGHLGTIVGHLGTILGRL